MPISNTYTQSTADATVYYDFSDPSDATTLRVPDTTIGMEENEVENILNDLATSSISSGDPAPTNSLTNAPSATLPSSPLHEKFSAMVHQAGTPPPVFHLFPELNRDDIVCIMTHQLEARNLNRLQPTISDGDPEDIEHATFDSLYLLLLRYFEIVSMYFAQDYLITLTFFEFLAHFQRTSAQYEWPAVRQYTLSFFDRRRQEMHDSNDYSGWLRPDEELTEKYLVGNEKGGVLSMESSTTISSPDTAPSRVVLQATSVNDKEGGVTSMASSTAISILDSAPQVVSSPANVNDKDEASRTATLFVGFLCSFIGLTLAAIIMIPFSLARFLIISTKASEIPLEQSANGEEDLDFYD